MPILGGFHGLRDMRWKQLDLVHVILTGAGAISFNILPVGITFALRWTDLGRTAQWTRIKPGHGLRDDQLLTGDFMLQYRARPSSSLVPPTRGQVDISLRTSCGLSGPTNLANPVPKLWQQDQAWTPALRHTQRENVASAGPISHETKVCLPWAQLVNYGICYGDRGRAARCTCGFSEDTLRCDCCSAKSSISDGFVVHGNHMLPSFQVNTH